MIKPKKCPICLRLQYSMDLFVKVEDNRGKGFKMCLICFNEQLGQAKSREKFEYQKWAAKHGGQVLP